MKKRLGLALGGGSALGNAHLGVLQCFHDRAIPIDCIAGTSAGAVVAACYAFGVSIETMRTTAEKLSWRSISKFSPSKLGIISNEALAGVVKGLIGGDHRIEDARMPLAIVAADISTGEKVVYRSGSVLQAVRASAAIPIVFTPVVIGNDLLVDGGLLENVPMSPLVSMGADVRVGVNLSRWMPKKIPGNILDIMDRSISIMSRYTIPPLENEVMIEPHLEEYASSDFQKGQELADHGYRAAAHKIAEIEKLLGEKRGTVLQRLERWLRE
ncbi:MAG TPA: patatin-like phospholipase family protein [Candidatus Paceibacterota bacterium]|nr:patatin-like phospholipase family protein [Candidatus Paceibacterota bacterium]